MTPPTASPPQTRPWWSLVGFLAVVFVVALVGGQATASSVGSWYAELSKPTWNPPAWIFGPVWSLLYAMMAVVAWRLWRRRASPPHRTALRWWWAQLIANALWSPLFFGLRAPGLALLDIVVLLALLIVVGIRLWHLDRLAGLLWLPYLAWVSFATLLNFTLWRLN